MSHLFKTEVDVEHAPAPAAQAQRSSLCELDDYLNEPAPPPGTDVLQWWGQHEDRWPHVARMAAQYLGCPASSATVERFFSLAGRLLDKTTPNMKETTLEDRMWAKINRGKRATMG